VRYTVNAPTGTGHRYLGSALTPPLIRPSIGYASRGRVSGHPGTLRIPMPAPPALHSGVNDLVNVGISRTSDAPPFFLPSVYYENGNAYGDHEHAPVSTRSDNQMPVPALRPANVLVFDPYRARLGGQRQVVQPQVVQRWLGMRGTPNG
jgi:hypothetical protein